ncbi:condensin subunit Smc [Cetobacterium ceti]|uniref:Chromosome partition protein Smc n=1 Tax=Cetobacterium ceti TaxID=180163 RepID=A0A1T4JVX7_9FUSO|nr:chromosome segregation protein SMC [Cetobacterium ceti]SJZ34308.1 condensin subunit Smc [Cetobacterium ceti]
MYLKGVEIAGFKSFGERVNINFNQGITSIVGPNGSGKSNILDSILWVLGEQSYKNIRAKESKDIIFSGGEGKKPANFAEVSLHIDNRDRFFPVELEKVKVTRKMYQSGENEYLLNDKKIRLKDINDMFLDTGIGKSAYSVIGQGKVERIISSSNRELKGIIEEAAGIKKFQQQKLESIKKLKSVQEELEKIELILKELKLNRDKIEKQSHKALEYLELESKVKEFSKIIYSKEFKEKIDNLKVLESNKNNLQNDFNENEKTLESKNEKLKNIETRRIFIKKEIENFINKNEKLKTSLENLEREKVRLKEREESYLREIEEKKEYSKSVEKKEKEKKLEIEKINIERQELSEKIEVLKNKNNDFEKNIEILENKKKDIRVTRDLKRNKLMDLEVTNLKLLNEIENSGRRLKGSQGKIENHLEEKKKLSKEKELEDIKYSNVIEKREKTLKEFTRAEQETGNLENEISRISREINFLSRTLRDLEFEEKKIKEKFLYVQRTLDSNEGFYKGVKEILNKKINGVHGAFISLIEVPDYLEKAIEASASGNLQDIVVESSEVAKECIDILKRSKSGRASFLPMDTVKDVRVKEYPLEDDVLGRLNDLITYDKKYEIIMKNILGNILVVKNIDKGLKLLKTNKFLGSIVTLSGELLSSRGRITGGENSNSAISQIFDRKKEKKHLEENLKEASKNLKEKKKVLNESNEKLGELEETLMDLDEKREKIKRELKVLDEEDVNQRKKVERLHKEIKIIELEILEEENYHREYSKKIENSEKEKINTESLIEKLREDIKEEEQNILVYEKDIEILKNNFSDTRLLYLNTEDKYKNLEGNLIKEEETIKNILSESKKIEERIKEIKKELENIFKTSDNIDSEIKNISSLYEKENEELIKIKEENEELEVLEKNLYEEKQRLEKYIYSNREKLTHFIQNIKVIKEDLEKIEFKLEKLKEVKISEKNLSEEITKEKLGILEEKLNNFETVNLLAIEEFKDLNEKYEFMNNQKNDLSRGEKSLNKLIEDVSGKIEERFYTAFNEISENFNNMCMETLDNSEGKLTLSNSENFENCGVEISVKFKNKKSQSLSLLSGGEKSMVAVAFVMSIFMYKPSPFTFLDEIEAALDEKNTRKLIKKLKEFTDKSQFIMITHNKETMKSSDSLYGVTMNKKIGISKLVPVKL